MKRDIETGIMSEGVERDITSQHGLYSSVEVVRGSTVRRQEIIKDQ
jgi:hypothetical protein